jgi:hypothetical protein
MASELQDELESQRFANEYELVDGVAMHRENGDQFQIPPDFIKKYVGAGDFVELRIDSPRFSVHEDDAAQCACPSCNGEMSKPILRHLHPASLVPSPEQRLPSRGWGEDFWVRIEHRDEDVFRAIVDNPLYESLRHELQQGDRIVFHANHILAIHEIHRRDIVSRMDEADLEMLGRWLKSEGG